MATLSVEPRGRRKDPVLMSVLVAVSMMTNPDPPCFGRCCGRCESAPWPGAAPSNFNSRLRAVMRGRWNSAGRAVEGVMVMAHRRRILAWGVEFFPLPGFHQLPFRSRPRG